MNDFFRQNDLCNAVHDDKNIWFCKFEFLQNDIEQIKKIKNDITLIVGNSDCTFTEKELNIIPDNVKKIYASNSCCSDNTRVFTIPIGVESTNNSKRYGHGIKFDFASEKETYIKKAISSDNEYKNLILCNFSLHTNFNVRSYLIQNCINIDHITVSKNNLTYENYYAEICKHKANLCPIGNGIDTVRTYETLYCNRIPIIYGSDLIYKNLLFDLPCVYLDDVSELKDMKFIEEKINKVEKNFQNVNKVYLKYWINKIKQK